ncbi:MAG TPA: DUF397 domain-containing protein [Pseudonocardiaceae bacterium]|nr:DUF397 domain-containing protein [Pseudonocardiaceae bacterium]
MTAYRWRKSSRSNQETACVEIAHTLDRVRDSKNPDGPTLNIDATALLAGLKAGHLTLTTDDVV